MEKTSLPLLQTTTTSYFTAHHNSTQQPFTSANAVRKFDNNDISSILYPEYKEPPSFRG